MSELQSVCLRDCVFDSLATKNACGFRFREPDDANEFTVFRPYWINAVKSTSLTDDEIREELRRIGYITEPEIEECVRIANMERK